MTFHDNAAFRHRFLKTAAVLSMAVSAVACGSGATKTWRDEGDVCVASRNGETALNVVFAECESYCAEVLAAECSVEVVDDGTLEVTSFAELEEAPSGPCSAACQPVSATCTHGEQLEPGRYEATLGDSQLSIDFPTSPACD